MQILVLAHLEDDLALGVAAGLRQKLDHEQVQIVAAESLALAEFWLHRLEPSVGENENSFLRIENAVRLANGAWLRPTEIKVIFNRLRYVPALQFTEAARQDREYAGMELMALWVSWLASLANGGVQVINPVGHGSFVAAHSRLVWLRLADQAGLAVAPYHLNSTVGSVSSSEKVRRCLAAGRRSLWLDDPQETLHPQLERSIHTLQRLSGCPLLEIEFLSQPEQAEGRPSMHNKSKVTSQPGEANWAVRVIDAFPQQASPAGIAAIEEMLAEAGQ